MAAWKASLKRGGNCGACERTVASLPSYALQRSPRPPDKGHLRPPRKGTVFMHRIVQFVNHVKPSNKRPVHQLVYFSYCTKCNVSAPFINGHRLATCSNGQVDEWDVVAPSFLCQNGELSLLSSTGNTYSVRTPLLTSGYPGQAQSCPFLDVLATSN